MNSAIYSLAQLRALEERAKAAHIDLMQQAARACADWVSARYPSDARLLVAAGPGNNGGDALYAAALLQQRGYRVTVCMPAVPATSEARQALAAWQQSGEPTHDQLPDDAAQSDLIIDGLFGIGISRPFSQPWCQLIQMLNSLNRPILALDTPSGLDAWRGTGANAVIKAQATLTFLCHKPGLFSADGSDLAGQVFLAPLDHPGWDHAQAEGALNHGAWAHALQRQKNSHKGRYGCVSIIGGCQGMLGASLLAGRSALAAGAGKVHVCTLDERLAVDPVVPELMLSSADHLPVCDVIAIGPGLGQAPAARVLLLRALQQPLPLVVDADALNLLVQDPALQSGLSTRTAATVLTPHPAEAARLLQSDTATVQGDRLAAARRLARQFNAIVVLKGAGSLIVQADGYYYLNTTGGPALAAAGQGDVLTGMIAALLGQGLDALAAAALAVYTHGHAGDAYQTEQHGPIGLTASATALRLGPLLNQLMHAEHG